MLQKISKKERVWWYTIWMDGLKINESVVNSKKYWNYILNVDKINDNETSALNKNVKNWSWKGDVEKII